MSGWISSKLKVAETLLQQIDQQAAESLRKNEASRSADGDGDSSHAAIPKNILPPLKDQLNKKKKKSQTDFVAKSQSRNDVSLKVDSEVNVNPKSTLTDGDWTQLLSAPSNKGNGGLPKVSGLLKDGKRPVRSGSNLLALDRKRSQAVVNKSSRTLGDKGNAERVDGDGDHGGFNSMQAGAGGQGVAENLSSETETVRKDAIVVTDENDGTNTGLPAPPINGHEMQSASDSVPDLNLQVKNEKIVSDSSMLPGSGVAITSSSKKTESVSASDGELDVETDSDSSSSSSSDSESEREREERRKRRERLLAEKAAAKAIEAIKDRENLVARLEGEKQSLEKIIDERAKQQAHEASQLQMTLMETMDAVDLEKQKHNNTRMEALMKLAKLETTNAELAKSLAAAQWSLEVEVKRVAELHRQIELKEASHEELTSKKETGPRGSKLTASRGVEFEHEILEAEHAFVADKVGQLQEKVKTLERDIEETRKEIENPSEVEVELKRRLNQLTDHLIQKQAQVEALSSEKAMLTFRIEAVSRSLDESLKTSKMNDIESGVRFQEKGGEKHVIIIGSLVRQLDSIFWTFLRRNPMGKVWCIVYLVCLHFWVLYIFRSHTAVANGSGAVISLENINNTGV
ncbi:putative Golgin subfamily A member 5 protein [Helianthus annuus]|nr:putative Golgin subfamily A member 5 protein [Helianthus annuus]KAJ0719401.1 putative Golgin subfamily A member 5 protein [Helianthus annuus]